MTINTPIQIEENNNFKYKFNIQSDIFKNILWFEVDKKYREFVSDSCDSALITLLIPAMDANENIHINGHISEELYSNILKIQKILKIIIPKLKLIKITTNELRNYQYDSKYIATGFSAGIDSFSTLYDYYYNCELTNKKITHLTYHNVGSHNIGETGYTKQSEDLFNSRFKAVEKITSSLWQNRIPLIKINSNIDDFYMKDYLYFMQTHTLRNMSVTLFLQKGIKNYYYSSGYPYINTKVSQSYDICVSDPILLPLISNSSILLEVTGSEYTRVEKTINVSKLEDAKNYLDVCVASTDGSNCSKCFKCMRTQFTLELAGKLEEFTNVFNFEVYKKEKPSYITKLLKDNDPFSLEILEYAKSKNYKFPIIYKKYGKIIKFLKKFKKSIKGFK